MLIKLSLSLILLGFLLSQIDFPQLLGVLAAADPFYLGVILVGYIIGQVVSCFRWTLLAEPLGFKFIFKDYLAFYFIGMFFNLFAPSTVGGDASRVFYLAYAAPGEPQWGRRATCAVISVLMDRIVGMAAMVWMAAAALAAFPFYPIPAVIHYIIFALALAFVLAWLFLPLLNRVLERAGFAVAGHLRLSLEAYWSRQKTIANTLLLSLAIHAIQALLHLMLARGIGVDMPASYGFLLYPLAGIFSALPLSLNGIGLRENAYLFLLTLIGIRPEKAVAFGLLWFLMVVLDSLIGGVVYVGRRGMRPREGAFRPEGHVR
ncbi:MAG TPA: lysylphosphatidylglycerol synthase transmembrane domain-containing protein [Candidatus Acidoferrales bacterium]|nr:lysylphosphatidylglycerol synthase transmembrane domain-containing protein [Candidatus Acidoferrales bacterium]